MYTSTECPCDCVLDNRRFTGKASSLDARTRESAKVNESNTLFLYASGERIGLRQVSGKIARHIVCPINSGDTFSQGQQFGMIKYGSTTELILPRPGEVTLHVSEGDKVLAGVTRFATLPRLASD